jgi:hypothetical protein
MCLFVIKKIDQQKTLSGQQKKLSIKEKFGLGRVCFPESGFRETISKLSCVCLPLGKLVDRKYFPVNEKHFLVKGRFGLVSRKVFSFYFGWKTLSGSCEKFINFILFAEYIKFGPQTFDCYIYFVLNIFFSISSLRFNFYINFAPHFYNCYLIFPYHFLIEIFYLSNLILILLIVTYFI